MEMEIEMETDIQMETVNKGGREGERERGKIHHHSLVPSLWSEEERRATVPGARQGRTGRSGPCHLVGDAHGPGRIGNG